MSPPSTSPLPPVRWLSSSYTLGATSWRFFRLRLRAFEDGGYDRRCTHGNTSEWLGPTSGILDPDSDSFQSVDHERVTDAHLLAGTALYTGSLLSLRDYQLATSRRNDDLARRLERVQQDISLKDQAIAELQRKIPPNVSFRYHAAVRAQAIVAIGSAVWNTGS